MQVDPRVLEAFEDDLSDDSTDMVDVLWRYVAPEMAAMERARRATLLSVASPRDRNGHRGRLHTLLCGEAGTGKSIIRDWLGDAFDAMKVGPKSTQAGLKGSTTAGAYSPGALALAHGMYFVPDELDEFEREDRGALLEAMGKGEFDVTQDGLNKTVPAEVTVVAACNRTGRFRDELLDRFDFVVEVEEYDADETLEVAETILDGWAEGFVNGDTSAGRNPLLGYIDWIQSYDVTMANDATESCKRIMQYLVREHGETGNIRGKEAILRTAFTWARLNREPMDGYHFLRAAAFIHPEYADSLEAQFSRLSRS